MSREQYPRINLLTVQLTRVFPADYREYFKSLLTASLITTVSPFVCVTELVDDGIHTFVCQATVESQVPPVASVVLSVSHYSLDAVALAALVAQMQWQFYFSPREDVVPQSPLFKGGAAASASCGATAAARPQDE